MIKGSVELHHLMNENTQRPPVCSDMMNGNKQNVLRLMKAQKGRSQHGIFRQVKALLRFLPSQPLYFCFFFLFGQGSKGFHRYLHRNRRIDHLYRLSIHNGISRPQYLMTIKNLLKASLQNRYPKVACQTDRVAKIIDWTFRFILIQKPQPLLGK